MSLLANLFRLTPPTLRANYCPLPPTWQQLVNDAIGGTQLTALVDVGAVTYNLGATTPLPEMRVFPWINTTNGKLWVFQSGVWTTPRPASDFDFTRLWKPAAGTPESALWTIGGGDGTDPTVTPPTATTGSMWQVDHDFDLLFPIGVGTSPDLTVAVSGTGGELKHTLTELEGAVGNHSHLFGVKDPTASAAALRANPLGTAMVPAYNGRYIGGNTPTDLAETTADLRTLAAGDAGAGVVPQPFSLLPRYRGVWFVRATARQFETLAA